MRSVRSCEHHVRSCEHYVRSCEDHVGMSDCKGLTLQGSLVDALEDGCHSEESERKVKIPVGDFREPCLLAVQ